MTTGRPRLGPVLWMAAMLAMPWGGGGIVSAQEPPGIPLAGDDASCTACHSLEAHATPGHGDRVPCLSCHAADRHRAQPRDQARAARSRSAICVQCHQDVPPTHPSVAGGQGRPLCTDCHTAHADPPLEAAGPAIARRCGQCHDQELADFEAGGHAAAIASEAPNPDVPTCVTCHGSHTTADAGRSRRLELTALCIDCHSRDLLITRYGLPAEAGKTYTTDFHGATLRFLWRHPTGKNQPEVMVCSDCHGAHKVGWLDHGEVAAVCLDCHEQADPKIAGAWLGHQPVGPDHGVAVWAVRIAYYVFIPLVLGGLLLHILLDLRHQRRLGQTVHRRAANPKARVMVTRFNPLERIEHLLAMVLFTLLVLTGLPQSFPDSTVGNWFVTLWGGIGSTRVIHRVVGVLFVGLLVLHVGRAVVGAFRRFHVPQMFPTRKDFADAWQTVRHYLGSSPRPRVGKFDFREKFEYWGLFLGGTVMSVTGFILLFPEGASQLLPGSLIAAARVVHGLEATFAVLVVILWHSYGVMLRPEIFPLDTSIFTGKISLERLEEEHPLEYERIFGRIGRTEEAQGKAPAGTP